MDGKLFDLQVSKLLEKFGAGSHKPGSGSAAALQGILGANLLLTVIMLTKDKKRQRRYSENLPKLLDIESEIKNRLLPELEDLFHEDSKQFDIVIKLRTQREQVNDAEQKKVLANKAVNALILATEIPIEIAEKSLKIARFALQVFDDGFQSARGDSGVAINSALAAVTGCLSIVELNLLSFGANDWTQAIQEAATKIRDELQELQAESQHRLSEQFSLAEENRFLHLELQNIRTSLKGKTLTEGGIEQLAIKLQRTLWRYRKLIWKNQSIDSPFKILKPERVLRLLGFQVERSTTLGNFEIGGKLYDIAGQIDQNENLVSISELLPEHVQNNLAIRFFIRRRCYTAIVLWRGLDCAQTLLLKSGRLINFQSTF